MSDLSVEIFTPKLLLSAQYVLLAAPPLLWYMVLILFLVGWRTWRGIVTGFIPVGICLVAVMQWRAIRRYDFQSPANHWQINLYCMLPLRYFSRTWGWFAEKQMPEFLRPFVYGLYASTYKVNLKEAISDDLKSYKSLADFFSRSLKPGVRAIDIDSSLTSPCDGKVLNFGTVNSCKVEQVKGVTYSLEQFLGKGQGPNCDPDPNAQDYRQSLLVHPENKPTLLYQCVLYLAPGDYHRFHSPADWKPKYRRHISGELLSVSPFMARWIPGLFTLNERVVYLGEWLHGFFSFTAVGATNVGSIKMYCDKPLHTNCKKSKSKDVCTLSNVKLIKGDPLGEFRMGSTIVLIFEAPANFEFHLTQGQTIRMGQPLGSIRKMKYVDGVGKQKHEMTSAA